ncbi:serine protease [Sphingomonadaceae bacterium G21617-S1]|nr:serine protease [Sphingomonadaceae bacterium G21617-S1]
MARHTALMCTLAALIGSALLLASRPASAPAFIKYRDTARALNGGSPRRPFPNGPLPVYYESAGVANQSRQGTTFIVDPKGTWATAAHVTDRCAAIRFVVNQRAMPPVATPVLPLGEDISLITGGVRSPSAFSIAAEVPRPGAKGYHMGFPMGAPGLVGSRLLGRTSAVRHAGQTDAILAWLEDWRTKEPVDELDGLSGGPVLNDRGQVVGIVSMASERRGRILTAMPGAVRRWLAAEAGQLSAAASPPIADRRAAVLRFQFLINHGFIRQVYCDVPPLRGTAHDDVTAHAQ